MWQARHVAALIGQQVAGADIEIVIVETGGDRDLSSPLHTIGGKGIFVKEVQAAVLEGRADIAVHSAKDLPALTPDGLVIAAVPGRGDPRDALVGCRLTDLPPGATVATGSVRRRAQLRALRPDLAFEELRGNIATRLEKAAGFDAIVMAATALDRLGIRPDVVDELAVETMVPQVGQGALAVECRVDDDGLRTALRVIGDRPTERLVVAERAFLAELGGDCSLPAAAHAVIGADDRIELAGFLASEDLERSASDRVAGPDGPALGAELARRLRGLLEQR